MRRRHTKFRMMAAFSCLLQKYEYEDITVTMISDYVGVSRQAFYKLFDSKQDLCAQMIITVFRDSLKSESFFTWESLVYKYLTQIKENMDFFHTLSTPQFDRMAHNAMFWHIRKLITEIVVYRSGKDLDEDMDNVVCCYSIGVSYMLMDITRRGVMPDSDKINRQLYMAMPQVLRDSLLGISFPVSLQQNTFPGKDENGLALVSDFIREYLEEEKVQAANN